MFVNRIRLDINRKSECQNVKIFLGMWNGVLKNINWSGTLDQGAGPDHIPGILSSELVITFGNTISIAKKKCAVPY